MPGLPNGRLHVIYIDDDPINLTVVSHILAGAGAAVTCCRTPREGLEELRSRPFHVGLFDIHMPEMSGIELLAQLRREIGPNRAMPALALTADLSRDERDYQGLGFDGFIAKPVGVRALLVGILEVLISATGATAPEIAHAVSAR